MDSSRNVASSQRFHTTVWLCEFWSRFHSDSLRLAVSHIEITARLCQLRLEMASFLISSVAVAVRASTETAGDTRALMSDT